MEKSGCGFTAWERPIQGGSGGSARESQASELVVRVRQGAKHLVSTATWQTGQVFAQDLNCVVWNQRQAVVPGHPGTAHWRFKGVTRAGTDDRTQAQRHQPNPELMCRNFP